MPVNICRSCKDKPQALLTLLGGPPEAVGTISSVSREDLVAEGLGAVCMAGLPAVCAVRPCLVPLSGIEAAAALGALAAGGVVLRTCDPLSARKCGFG